MKKRPLGRSIEPTIQNSVGSPAIMVKGMGRIGSVFCLVILLLPYGLSETPVTDDSPQLIIDQNQGMLIESSLNISGVYIDEETPVSLTWKIFNGVELIAEGDLLDSLTESGDSHGSSRNSWGYGLDLNFTNYAPCSCLLEIVAEDTNNQYDSAQLILFSHGGTQDALAPSIILINQPNQLTGTVELQAIAMDGGGFVGAQWGISNSSEVAISCMQSLFESPESIQWNNMTTALLNTNQILTLDTTNYADGDYSILVRAVSDGGLYSPCACLPVGIDNNPPTALIEGPNSSDEFSGFIQFDGTGSSDQYWGQEDLVFLWILEDEFGEKTIEDGINLRTFAVDASISGNYTLTLTVADDAGFSDTLVHQFNITNEDPVAALRIGGQALEDGDSITLTDSQQWLVECGDSTDTDNDQSGLVCTWYIDEEPVMTGWSRQLQRPEDLSAPHTLMLEVTDNDGASDTISVVFGVQDTPSDPSYVADEGDGLLVILAIVGASVLALFLLFALFRRYSGEATSIPKWKRE